jgi:hypothetical protein
VLLEIAEQESIQSVLQPGASPVLANTSGVGWGGDEGLTAAEWSGMSVGEQEDWVRGNCFDCQHASGTCRMGQEDDPKTVVSSEVRSLRPPPLLLHCSCLRAYPLAARVLLVTRLTLCATPDLTQYPVSCHRRHRMELCTAWRTSAWSMPPSCP